jgi:hypothetical protein
VTRMSKSKTRSVVAIGYGCVIPAQAGIQRLFGSMVIMRRTPLGSRFLGNDG